ncbi:12129_t:CDS:2 [Gigaspora margarita]|uniref:12129_t:CDS:1 n=1 Tax=Gigaspora margarita TaxID=4874 RepID=A0ABN7UQS8_GIGMA|nr:12129_t:CDS:2 [Gigaspora margarita]
MYTVIIFNKISDFSQDSSTQAFPPNNIDMDRLKFWEKKITICIDGGNVACNLNPEDKLAKVRTVIIDKGITNRDDFVFKWPDGKIVKHPDEENSNNLSMILANGNTLHISTLQESEVTIYSNDEKSFCMKLHEGSYLSEIRRTYEVISPAKGLYIGSNCYFLDQDKNIILKNNEGEKILSEILKIGNSLNSLHIFRENEPDWIKLADQCEYGFSIEDASVKQVRNRVFKFTKKETVDNIKHYERKTLECKNKFEELCYRNFITFGNATSILPWASIFFGHDKENLSKKLESFNTKTEYSYIKKRCAMIKITKENISLTIEFKNEVEAALNEGTQDEKVAKLRKIAIKYGHFYASTIYFGGVIVQKAENIEQTDENENINKISIQGGAELPGAIANVDINSTAGNYSSTSKSKTKYSFIIKGGDDAKIFTLENSSDWINSLKNTNTWDMIEYEDVNSIFDLLDDDLRKRVLKTLGKRILKANIESIEYIINNNKPKAHPLGKQLENITNIEECEIFSTIMKKKDRHIFSSYISYDAPDKPINPHTIDANKYNRYTIDNIKPTDLQDIQYIKDMEQYVLATCILDRVEIISNLDGLSKNNEKQLNPRDSKLIVGTHFSLSKDSAYSFSKNIDYSITNSNPVLRLCICNIYVGQGSQRNYFYQIEAIWDSLKKLSLERGDRDVFCSEIENINEKLAFAYLLFKKCQLDCNHCGVVNIANTASAASGSSNYILCKLLDRKSLNKNEVSCFCLPQNKKHGYNIDENHKIACEIYYL